MRIYNYPTVTLPDGDKRFRSLEFNDDGDFVYEQSDQGPMTAKLAPNGGDSDYEYWVTVKEKYIDEVLFNLVGERFESQGEFKRWLEDKNITYSFYSY